MYRRYALDSSGGARRTGFGYVVASRGGFLRGAAGRCRGNAFGEIPRTGRPLFMDAPRFRALAGFPLLLGLLDGDSVLVSQRRYVLHERRVEDAGAVVRASCRQP